MIDRAKSDYLKNVLKGFRYASVFQKTQNKGLF